MLVKEGKEVVRERMRDRKVPPVMVAIILMASALLNCLPLYAEDTATSVNVLNSAPSVDVELTPDEDPVTPGVQVINSDPGANKTVTIIANVTDMNGHDDLSDNVTANITGHNIVEDNPVSLSLYGVVNVTAVTYKGSFNMSSHSEGDYKVEVTAADFGGLNGIGSKNFTYLYATPSDTTPPAVTNPSANHPSIVADGTQESGLTVTITDESGIYSVTVDLSSLGEPAAKEMVKIEGTDIYTTTTTAAVGTSPATYFLQVNTTDNSPNRNSNTSVSIPLTVLPPEVVTTYDFTTGAGSDKWAFRKQHFDKSPATNDVPRIKFSTNQYNKIKRRDRSMQIDQTSRRNYFAIHQFLFKIAEPEANITNIDVSWIGLGFRYIGTKGATLYIWNFNTGKYEQLDRSNRIFMRLHGEIANNVADYIDANGNLILIAEQNSPRKSWRWFMQRSIIGTDYVRVNVTYIPQQLKVSETEVENK